MTIYPNPPITEALIDIKTTPREDVSAVDISDLHQYIKSDYPNKKEQRRIESKIEAKKGEQPIVTSVDRGIFGFFFHSADDKQIVQYKIDGFTFNRLPPYEKWDKIFGEAQRLWGFYKDYLKPTQVTRVAVRYINKINIPLRTFNLDDYFTAAPKMPDDLDQPIEEFYSKITIQFPSTETKAIVTMKTFPTKNPTVISILLDIDVFKEVVLGPDDSAIWDILLNHRQIKNDIFEKNITNQTRELFK